MNIFQYNNDYFLKYLFKIYIKIYIFIFKKLFLISTYQNDLKNKKNINLK